MGEGYWIRSDTGQFFKIDEHARWIQVTENARLAGLDDEAITRIASIRWDIDGPGRKAIVLAATARGLIRFRDHGGFVTFEFQMPLRDALLSLQPFMEFQLGPARFCRLNDLRTGESWECSYREMMASAQVVGSRKVVAALRHGGPFHFWAPHLALRRAHPVAFGSIFRHPPPWVRHKEKARKRSVSGLLVGSGGRI